MHLTPRELDKLMIYMMAEVALKRKAKGLKLNHPEAVAVITASALDGAREGKTLEQVMKEARATLTRNDVMEGVAEMIPLVQLEAVNARLATPAARDADALASLRLLWPGYFAEPAAAPPLPDGMRISLAGYESTFGSIVGHLEAGFGGRLKEITAPAVFVLGERSPIPATVSSAGRAMVMTTTTRGTRLRQVMV
jgi:urease subunit gamma